MSQFLARRRERLDAALAALNARIEALQTELAGLDGLGLPVDEREQRRQDLEAAIAAAEVLRTSLQAEGERLDAAPPRDGTDRAFELTVLARLAGLDLPAGPAALLAELSADPALLALEQAPALTSAAATATIQRYRALAGQRRPDLDDVPALRTDAGGDAPFDELAGILHARWLALADRPYLERDVAVLLPLRAETVFKEVGPAWDMWLRIVPDEASIRRDDPTPKPVEVAQLEAMWQAIVPDLTVAERARPPDSWLDTARGRLEFAGLSTRVGGGRAAWLVAACPPVVNGEDVSVDAPNVGAESLPNRVGGLPSRIDVWVAFGNAAPTLLDTAEPNADALDFDVIGARPAGPDTTDLVEAKDRWWVSWTAAQDVGLGRVIRLPAGHTPHDITTIYLVGLGEESPEEHFRAQIDAGEMATLALGAPTNAVDGALAANLGHDAGVWRDVARQRLRQRQSHLPDETELTRSLAGVGADLPAMPLADALPELDLALVRALWPALWGHQLRDIWGCLDESDRLAGWAVRYLRPEGPLPPVRVSDQPYGLLPTTMWSKWKVAGEEGSLAQFENRLRPGLLAMRSHWARAARAHGTVVGADTEKLMALISRDAVSASYAYRSFLAPQLWKALYTSIGGAFDPQAFDDQVNALYQIVYDLVGRGPDDPPGIRQYLTFGPYETLQIPLVVPTHWPDWYYEHDGAGNIRVDEHGKPVPAMSEERGFSRLLETLMEFGHRHDLVFEHWRAVLPDSLLIRLLLQAGALGAAAVVQVNAGPAAPIREPLIGDTLVRTMLADLSHQYDRDDSHDHPAGEVRRAVVEGLVGLFKAIDATPLDAHPLPRIERAFRATLDTATHRIDPWIVGMAARRLAYLRDRPDTRFRLGVYGWVDGPMLGKPGPTEGGLLHAPSHAQALTGAILRDKDISERLEVPNPVDGRHLWSIQLESDRIRLAEELAEEVRLGAHIFEALGRQVERVVGVRTPGGAIVEATSRVDTLRTTYPMKPDQLDRGRVCHGVNALAGLLDGMAPPLTLTVEQREELHFLRRVLDAYGDLLVAEAVHQVVTGHADRAGAAMDAAAGLGRAPALDFSETPLAGEGLTAAVVSAIPYRPSVDPAVAPDAATPPARLADASVAAALEDLVGAAEAWTWEGQAVDGALVTTTLASLGLEPADTLALSPDLLDDLTRAALDLDIEAPLGGTGRRMHGLARDIVRTLGSQAAYLRDVAPTTATPEEVDEVRTVDVAIQVELRERYAALRATAGLLADELLAARLADDAAGLRQALIRALRWGITPIATREQLRALYVALTRNIFPESSDLLPSLAQRAEESLRERLAAAPPLDPPAPRPGEPLAREPLAGAIAELAAPEGQIAILSRMSAATLARIARLQLVAPDTGLDTDWLTVVAAVRPRLATVEALQLEALTAAPGAVPGYPGLTAWSSAPGDPWQTAALAALRQRRLQPGGNDPRLVLPRFVAAYTTGDVWHDDGAGADPVVAVGLVDSWSEAVPRAGQQTTAVFGFNAPAARPPQAILLAVPPDLTGGYGAHLDTTDLIQILEETRELAHARAADAEELGAYLAAVPTTTFDATGPTGVRLDPSTTFPI